MPGTTRPVRMIFHGLYYRLDADEALNLANQLADAVEQLDDTTTVKGTPA